MTHTTIQLTEEEFDDRYQLVRNHLNPNASWAYGEDGGCLFETYGDELDFVRQQAPGTVRTFVDGDDGDQYLLSGFHLVNRIGYLIATTPVPEDVSIEERIPMDCDDDPESVEVADPQPTTGDLLTRIAGQHLGIPTLEERKSDRLDFHDLSVWGVRDALEAAYQAGQRRTSSKLLAVLNRCATLLADYDEQEGEEGDAYRDAMAAIAEATTLGRQP